MLASRNAIPENPPQLPPLPSSKLPALFLGIGFSAKMALTLPYNHDPLHTAPALRELCLRSVAANFEASPMLSQLPENQVPKLVGLLSLELPLELAGQLITSEDYWQRRAKARWSNCETSGYSRSWKQLYFQRNMEDALEQFDPEVTEVAALRRLLTFGSRFVRSLHLQQLPSHLDLQILFDCMHSGLVSLSLTYSLRNIKMNYDRALFGMKLGDCKALARALEHSETLVCLQLAGNLLEDDKARMLASGLADNHSVTHLDLSHNKIADRGVRALAKVLGAQSVITGLDLHDNQIHAEGGRAIARAMRHNNSLVTLNLRLNRLEDAGCEAICDVLPTNTSLEQLSLGANGMGLQATQALVSALKCNTTLKELELSSNGLGEEGGRILAEAIEVNTTLESCDVRLSQMNEDDEVAISEVFKQRTLKNARRH